MRMTIFMTQEHGTFIHDLRTKERTPWGREVGVQLVAVICRLNLIMDKKKSSEEDQWRCSLPLCC